jgi:hypothetical protein
MNDFDISTWYGLDYTLDNLNATNAKLIEENCRYANIIIDLREEVKELNLDCEILTIANHRLESEQAVLVGDLEAVLQRYELKRSRGLTDQTPRSGLEKLGPPLNVEEEIAVMRKKRGMET